MFNITDTSILLVFYFFVFVMPAFLIVGGLVYLIGKKIKFLSKNLKLSQFFVYFSLLYFLIALVAGTLVQKSENVTFFEAVVISGGLPIISGIKLIQLL